MAVCTIVVAFQVVKMQLECSEDDLQHSTLEANSQDDFIQAVQLWQADLQRVQQIMEERIGIKGLSMCGPLSFPWDLYSRLQRICIGSA